MMPFKDPFALYYDAVFKPAIVKAKLDPVRSDDLFRPSVIVSDLWQMIQDAKVLLAELTTKNANVFYELGLAHAIGKPVVLVTETMDDVPFDLRQLRVLQYNKNDPAWGDGLCDSITQALQETLDKPVDAVPSIFRRTVPSQGPQQSAMAARVAAIESQVRTLRAQSFRPAPSRDMSRPWINGLGSVTTFDELEQWVKTWRAHGVPSRELYEAASCHPNLSKVEAGLVMGFLRSEEESITVERGGSISVSHRSPDVSTRSTTGREEAL